MLKEFRDLKWEAIDDSTDVAAVPGGWVMRYWAGDHGPALVFIPDPQFTLQTIKAALHQTGITAAATRM